VHHWADACSTVARADLHPRLWAPGIVHAPRSQAGHMWREPPRAVDVRCSPLLGARSMDSGNTDFPLPIQCPKCQHVGSMLLIKSITVMTLKCDSCGHTWATDLASLPPDIRDKVPDALREL
jgi:Zn ribbon nucleic-acid-binding protein